MSEFSLKGVVAMLLLASTACTGKQYAEQANEVVAVPQSYGDVNVAGGPELDVWCSDFGSPELEGLVDRAPRHRIGGTGTVLAGWFDSNATSSERAPGVRPGCGRRAGGAGSAGRKGSRRGHQVAPTNHPGYWAPAWR